MKALDVMPTPDERAGQGDDGLERDAWYFKLGRFERMRRSLDESHGRWVENYMDLVIAETRDIRRGEKILIRKWDDALADEAKWEHGVAAMGKARMNMEPDGRTEDMDTSVECALIDERVCMEALLVLEVGEWERKLWNMTREFICSEVQEKQEKDRVEREWKANFWKRLDANIRAMEARTEAANTKAKAKGASNDLSERWQEAHERIQTTWRSVMDRFHSVDHSQALPSIGTLNPEYITWFLATRPVYLDVVEGLRGARLPNRRDPIKARTGEM